MTRQSESRRQSPLRQQEGDRHRDRVNIPAPVLTRPPESKSKLLGRLVFPADTWRALARELKLSNRESQILHEVFDDEKESVIAANLGISSHTVHTHLERLYRKLAVSSRVSLVRRIFAEYLRLRAEDPASNNR